MKCKREQGRGNMEVSEDTKRGLYSKSLPWLNAIDDYWMSKIDLEHVNLNLTKTAEHGYTYRPLQKRAIINFTKGACGWGGVVKFQMYSEWNYKNYLEIVDRRWFETNTLDKYASGMATHKISFAMEPLHKLDCF